VGAASARLLRSDDFSDPARGLFADNQRLTGRAVGAGGQEFQYDYGYRNGSLVGKILGPYPDGVENVVLTAFAPATGLVPGDFAVEVTARAASSPNAAGYGIQIIAAREALYTLEVRPSDGFYRLFPQIAQPRRAPLSGRSPAIARGPQDNQLRLEARGDTVIVYANGQELGQVQDERLAGRPVGVRLAWTMYRPPAAGDLEVRFRDFKIFSIGS
jgi:hypothetical protein